MPISTATEAMISVYRTAKHGRLDAIARCTHVNNVYLLYSEYIADVRRLCADSWVGAECR